MALWIHRIAHRASPVAALVLLLIAMDGTWAITPSATAAPLTTLASPPAATTAGASPGDDERRAPAAAKRAVAGKLNLNTATEAQLMLLPSIGPAKAERIVAWRTKHGPFRRPADLRRVKGFGYKTFKRLEPFLAITGVSTLAPR